MRADEDEAFLEEGALQGTMTRAPDVSILFFMSVFEEQPFLVLRTSLGILLTWQTCDFLCLNFISENILNDLLLSISGGSSCFPPT